MVKDSGEWGHGFSSRDEAVTQSNDGNEFSWTVAGYQAIHGERENLEKEPNRVLSDSELQHADALVIRFGDGSYRTFASGPWEDWEELWDDVAEWYDTPS